MSSYFSTFDLCCVHGSVLKNAEGERWSADRITCPISGANKVWHVPYWVEVRPALYMLLGVQLQTARDANQLQLPGA